MKTKTAKIPHGVPIPTTCHLCGHAVTFESNAIVYRKPIGKWPWVYICGNVSCGAYVGCHPSTKIPLGYLADRHTRTARRVSKEQFKLMTNKLFSGNRGAAYAWLAKTMGIDPKDCHFGMFDYKRSIRAKILIDNFLMVNT